MEEYEETIESLYQIVQSEGYGYGLMEYKGLIEGECDDTNVKELWNNAVNSLNLLKEFFDTKIESGDLEEYDF